MKRRTRSLGTLAEAIVLAIVAAAAGGPLGPPTARASCGSESCPLALPESRLEGRRFSLDVSLQSIDQDRVRIGTRDAAVGELSSPEDEARTRNRILTLLGKAPVSGRWAVSAALPVVSRLHRHIANEEEAPEPREWHFTGLGDLALLAHWTPVGAGPGARSSLTLQAGLKLPTGRRHVEPDGGEEPEPPARPGTGSTDGILGVHLMWVVGVETPRGLEATMPLFASMLYRVTGRGTEGYRVGNQLEASLGANYPLGRRLDLLAQVNARFREKDDFGKTGASRDNTGGRAVYLSPGVRLRPRPSFAAYALVQVPVYQRVNRIQIVAPYNVLVGITAALP